MAGRPQHQPTEKDRKAVEAMASYGVPQADIARVIGVHVQTLWKWYGDELATAATKANSMIAQSLFQKATGNGHGAVAACIFWLKVRAGWVEPKPWEEQPSKKEMQQQAAETAAAGSEWANDLDIVIRN